MSHSQHFNDGPAEAAILSAGIGSATLGLVTVLCELSPWIKGLLNWWAPAGPLTGKTGTAVLVWLVSWVGFHFVWRMKEGPFNGKIFRWAMALIALGVLGTFPPFFELFSRH